MFKGGQRGSPSLVLALSPPPPSSPSSASLIGSWWDGLALDHHFDSGSNDWASMRSTWTDNNGLYVAMKAGNMTSHQTHGDIVSLCGMARRDEPGG